MNLEIIFSMVTKLYFVLDAICADLSGTVKTFRYQGHPKPRAMSLFIH